MIYTALLCDASGNERVIAYIGDGKNLELLLEAIRNPDLIDDIDVAIASYKEAAQTQAPLEGESVVCTIAEEPLWTEEELEQILVITEPDELDTPAISWRNPQKGQRITDRGWLTKRQWHKGYDNRITRHQTRAALAIVRRSFSK